MVSRKNILIKGAAIAAGLSVYETRKRSNDQLIDLAANLDEGRFGGWFARNGVRYRDIAAMWLTESLGDPRAVNLTGEDGAQGGAWGLGQVTARTATDYGILAPLAPLMLYPRIGGRISMAHVQFVVQGLRNNGRAGDHIEWVQAYNVGLSGFLSGRTNLAHYQRFLTHLT